MSHRADLLRVFRSTSIEPLDCLESPPFCDAARSEGMLPLLVERVALAGWTGVDPRLREALSRERAGEVARAAAAGLELRRVLAALRQRSVRALVLKGAALGWTLYPQPHLRPSVDIDLFIEEEQIGAAHQAFADLAAEHVPHVTGRFVMSQFHYATTDAGGLRHAFDVHWRVVNPLVFAGVLRPHVLFASAVRIPALGPDAWTVSDVHALMLGCIHKAAHHGGSARLIWLYDIHLLAAGMDASEWAAVIETTTAARMTGIVGRGLTEAHEAFGGEATEALARRIGAAGVAGVEPARRYLTPARRRVTGVFQDLKALDTWALRLQLLRELMLPPRAYMRARYPAYAATPLPLLYLARLLGGVRWFWR